MTRGLTRGVLNQANPLCHVIVLSTVIGRSHHHASRRHPPCRHSSACKSFIWHSDRCIIILGWQRKDTHIQATQGCTRGYQAIPAQEIRRSDPGAFTLRATLFPRKLTFFEGLRQLAPCGKASRRRGSQRMARRAR